MDNNPVMDRAILMADKDGRKWAELESVIKSAYIHNAQLAIDTENRPAPVVDKKGKVIKTCYYCGGVEWMPEGKPCPECNPRGLNPPEETVLEPENPTGPPAPTEEPEIKQPPADLKLHNNHYWCGKCGITHNALRRVGARHMKHKIEME